MEEWQAKMDQFQNSLVWWDNAKFHFKSISIVRAKTTCKLEHHKCLNLEKQLKRLQVKAQSRKVSDTERFLLVREALKQFNVRDLDSSRFEARPALWRRARKVVVISFH